MMQIGKASYNVLNRSILRPIHVRGSQILRAAGIGVDSSALLNLECRAIYTDSSFHVRTDTCSMDEANGNGL